MPRLIEQTSRIEAAGNKPKQIEEYVGRINTATEHISVAHMKSPPGWKEPGQRPEFEEITMVLQGKVIVAHEDGTIEVEAGQAIITEPGEWVCYSTPKGAEYIAICLPAFSPESVHRDEE